MIEGLLTPSHVRPAGPVSRFNDTTSGLIDPQVPFPAPVLLARPAALIIIIKAQCLHYQAGGGGSVPASCPVFSPTV
jgi:hypothetical protein